MTSNSSLPPKLGYPLIKNINSYDEFVICHACQAATKTPKVVQINKRTGFKVPSKTQRSFIELCHRINASMFYDKENALFTWDRERSTWKPKRKQNPIEKEN